ncbi:hypothetical protein EDC18_11335 [Natranaerovirga pectinivora]|uniref:Uncharacterized protein n=1 Tax=Natranaerovirga pectinivora TaxID=682400 RepID=A0A4R3MK81_9FIRM|nr:hypothetical protein [Natranaerovirga pectinivora]TCT12189.1 hypothetical protein EDC18_11335 [Natranaerovirga pectinivora]
MKKVVFGGMLFVGGAIIYSVGVLGFADVAVQAQYMQIPQYAGVLSMAVGIILGIVGLKKE